MSPDALQPKAYCTNHDFYSRSYLHRQVSPSETLVVKGPKAATSTHTLSGSFTCHENATWDKRFYFPSEGRCAEDFFALKNPTASAGFEPANFGTKGRHATSRPPRPLSLVVSNSVAYSRSKSGPKGSRKLRLSDLKKISRSKWLGCQTYSQLSQQNDSRNPMYYQLKLISDNKLH